MLSKCNQKTIKHDVQFEGQALQTGKHVVMKCKPATFGSGIVFHRTDLETTPSVRADGSALASLATPNMRRTTIAGEGFEVQTIEHFMAALWALEIDNLLVEIDNVELPAMDGSAQGFLTLLKETGTLEQPYEREYIRIIEEEHVTSDNGSISIYPAEKFTVTYTIDYDIKTIGKNSLDIDFESMSFEKELAPARTFCLKREAEALLNAGLGKGATPQNTVIIDENGTIGEAMRFPDEPLRHKIVDLIGDFYTLGRPIIGKVVAEKSGHTLNAMMIKKIYERYIKR